MTTVMCEQCGQYHRNSAYHVCPKLPDGVINAYRVPAPEDVVKQITTARGSVYGPFLHNAIVAQALKAAMRNLPDPDNERRWDDLPLDVREGLDLIALKMSRIVTGDPEYLDNWDDIAGYATIVAKRIRAAKGSESCGS